MLDATRLLFDLQHVNEIAQNISGCLEPDTVARRITDALVTQFDCAFARIWLVEPDQSELRLVASSGLYTHTNGSFARVPMGAYKVGKIALNRVPFLSNHLPDEPWVKDREWAIANRICGFAGYPLSTTDRTIGVLATFSHRPMAAEFLEVLQVLCMTATIALDAALQSQSLPTPPTWMSAAGFPTLSDQLAHSLPSTRIVLMGTEQPLTPSMANLVLRMAEMLSSLNCNYCRLTYGEASVRLEAIVAIANLTHPPSTTSASLPGWMRSQLGELQCVALCLGGALKVDIYEQRPMVQVMLTLPYPKCRIGLKVHIDSQYTAVQAALTHLAHEAGLMVCDDEEAIVLTDKDIAMVSDRPVIWVQHRPNAPLPQQVQTAISLTIEPDYLRYIVEKIHQGEPIPQKAIAEPSPSLSDREQEIMSLLSTGLRDRDIAQLLYISESTVKFHINNSQAKLNAKNRYQAVYQAAIRGWI